MFTCWLSKLLGIDRGKLQMKLRFSDICTLLQKYLLACCLSICAAAGDVAPSIASFPSSFQIPQIGPQAFGRISKTNDEFGLWSTRKLLLWMHCCNSQQNWWRPL